MSAGFPLVPLDEVLTRYREYIEQPEPKLYPKLSVKLCGKGVVIDAPVDGSTLKTKRHQIAKVGQVVESNRKPKPPPSSTRCCRPFSTKRSRASCKRLVPLHGEPQFRNTRAALI
jgi:hypothetical protein